jgi:hypothetical protein
MRQASTFRHAGRLVLGALIRGAAAAALVSRVHCPT